MKTQGKPRFLKADFWTAERDCDRLSRHMRTSTFLLVRRALQTRQGKSWTPFSCLQLPRMMYIIMVPLAGDSRDMRFGLRILSARCGQAWSLIGEMNVMAKNYVVAVDGAISVAPFHYAYAAQTFL